MSATWIDTQLRARGISDERVLEAMGRIPRELFVPEEVRAHSYEDRALPLGFGQTVSQPYVVAYMCEGLALEGGERVLDVGTGSGYGAAVLAELAGEVDTIERIPELACRARVALDSAGFGRVAVHLGDGACGLESRAPFDAIAVAAASPALPESLWQQLAARGRIVIPLVGRRGRQELCVFARTATGARLLRSMPARFVPLVF